MTVIGNGFFVPFIFMAILQFNLAEYDKSVETFPTAWELFRDHVFMLICNDFIFFCIHRLSHTPYLFKNFHKKHHLHYITVTIIAIKNDYMDYLFNAIIPFVSGQVIIGRVHAYTALIWFGFTTMVGILGHCGYNFPWHPMSVFPFGLNLDFHDFHHSHHDGGNYGFVFGFWDWFFQSNQLYCKTIHEREVKGID